MSFEIVVDSASNLPKTILDQYNMSVVSYHFTLNGVDNLCYDESKDYNQTCIEFYNSLREGADVRTSLINSEAYADALRPILDEGKDVALVVMSSGISGSAQSAKLAVDELREEYPDRKIYAIDTLGASLGEGLQAIKLAKLREEGKSIEDAVQYVLDDLKYMNQFFIVGDLKYLKKGGRISGAEAAIGNLLAIKPILRGDTEGKIVVQEKVRTRNRSIETLINYVANNITNAENQVIGLAHCDVPEEAAYVSAQLKERCHVKDVIEIYYDLCTGSHVGPGTIAIFFDGKERY